MSKKRKRLLSKDNQRQAKKAAVLGNEKKNYTKFIGIILCLILVSGAIWGYLTFYGTSIQGAVESTAPLSATKNTQEVTYPVQLFADGRARHFEHHHGDMTIKYFILKSSDGVLRAAFDACDVCWPAGLGYFQEGDTMVCRNCGRRFASVLVNEVKGGCNPAPLTRKVVGEQLVITIKDILEGRQYFDFSGRAQI
jgi:uncharacterized membrane protein